MDNYRAEAGDQAEPEALEEDLGPIGEATQAFTDPRPLEARAAEQAARYAAVHRTDAERAIWTALQLRNALAHRYSVDLSVAQLLRAMDATGTIITEDTTHRAARALEVIAGTALGPR